MSDSHASFVGSIPELYDRHLGPLFFTPYARNLAARLKLGSGAKVLELACGTGILTRELLATLPEDVSLTATDLNPEMLEVARARVPTDRVTWQIADAAALTFGPRSFDVVVCQFGMMFFPDKVQAIKQVRRVLRLQGAFLFNVWATIDENPIVQVANDVINGFFTADPPTFYQTPFGYADTEQIEEDLHAGRFKTIEVETIDIEGRSLSAADAAAGLVQGNPIVNAVRERATASVDEVTRAVAEALDRRFGPGEIKVPMRARVIRAR